MSKSRKLAAALATVASFAVMAGPAQAAPKAPDESKGVKADAEVVEHGFTVQLGNGQRADKPASEEEMAAAAGCWYVTWSRRLNNIFGIRLATYYQRIDWCSSRGYITSHSRNRYGTTSFPGWSWKGNIGSSTSGGNGRTWYRSWTQGHFCLAQYFSCVQNWYPWIDMTVYPGGTWRGTQGG